jgi:hypothetical protein
MLVGIKFDPFVMGAMIILVGIVIFMTAFVGQQVYYISQNLTQVELDKIDEWKELNPGKKYVHMYNKGILQNWKEFCCPPLAEKHPPAPLIEVPELPKKGKGAAIQNAPTAAEKAQNRRERRKRTK